MEALPSDTFFAIERLTEENEENERPSVVLKSQIYTLVQDRTRVEREIDALKRCFQIRLFRIKTDRQDEAILMKEQHDHDLNAFAETQAAHEAAILLKFKEKVLDTHCDPTIESSEFLKAMEMVDDAERERDVLQLLQTTHWIAEATTPKGRHSGRFSISSPRLGFCVADLLAGRKEILDMLKRRKHKEISETQLFQIKLRKSRLSIRYHVRDLIGLEAIQMLSTPAGRFYKLVRVR